MHGRSGLPADVLIASKTRHLRVYEYTPSLEGPALPIWLYGRPSNNAPSACRDREPSDPVQSLQIGVVFEGELECPRRCRDSEGAAVFGRRHQAGGRDFPLRAVSCPR
jgi:hypothetical protein